MQQYSHMTPQSSPSGGDALGTYMQTLRQCNYTVATWRRTAEQYGYEDCGLPLSSPQDPQHRHTIWSAIEQQTLTRPIRLYAASQCSYVQPTCNEWCRDWRFQADIIGAATPRAEQELITMALAMLEASGIARQQCTIVLNNRMALGRILRQYIGLSTVQLQLIMKLIDSKPRLAVEDCLEKAYGIVSDIDGAAKKLQQLWSATAVQQLPPELQMLPELRQLHDIAVQLQTQLQLPVQFSASMMQGAGRYMGMVFELRTTQGVVVASGGRYENVIASIDVPPAVTMQLDTATLQSVARTAVSLPSGIDVAMVVVQDTAMPAAIALADILRREGVRVEIDIMNPAVEQQVATAMHRQAPFIVFVGEEDIAQGIYTLRAMADKTEARLSAERIVTKVMDYRHTVQHDDDDEFLFSFE